MRIIKQPIYTQILSIILHPLLMPVYAVCLLFIYTDFYVYFASQFTKFLIPTILLSCIIPKLCIRVLKKLKIIENESIFIEKEHFLPFSIHLICYLFLFLFFHKAHLYSWFLTLLSVPIILLILIVIIGFWYKFSIHMCGIGALVGSLLSISYHVKECAPVVICMILFILAGCLGTAQLMTSKKYPKQIYIGFFVGLVTSYLAILVNAL